MYNPPAMLIRPICVWAITALLAAATLRAQAPPADPSRVPEQPGHYKLQFDVKGAAKTLKFPAMVYVPAGYNQNKDKRPLLLFLHDTDARGTDLAGVLKTGLDAALENDAKVREACQFLTLSPQCPADRQWTDPEILQSLPTLIADFAKRARVDEEKIYVCGLGTMGAAAAWQLACNMPDRFAAVVPTSMPTAGTSAQAIKLKYVAVMAVGDTHSTPGTTAARQTADALCTAGAEATCVMVSNGAGSGWTELFAKPRLYEWLGAHHKLTAQEKQQRDQRLTQLTQLKFPTTPGFHKLSYPAIVDGKPIDVPFLLTIPAGYDQLQSLKFPVLMFNHGAGEANLDTALVHGPNCAVNSSPVMKAWYPFVGVAPIWDNSPERIRAQIALLDEVIRRMRVDPDRVYATGLSMGGLCTWMQAIEAPDRFAAIAPICARAHDPETTGERVKYLSTWIIVGGADGDFTAGAVQMHDSLTKAKADVDYTVVPGEGHGIWIPYYAEQRFYEWLLLHRRLTPEERVARDKTPPPAVPNKPGQYRMEFEGPGLAMHYGVYLPKTAGQSTLKYPLLVYLHHESDKAKDFSTIVDWGSDSDPRKDPKLRYNFAMIAITPQCPADKNWTDPDVAKAVVALIDDAVKKLPVDPGRVYLTGTGTGCAGTWQIAMDNPDRFAAVAPVLGTNVPFDQAAAKIKAAVWMITPANDNGAVQASKQALAAFQKARVELRLSTLPQTPAPAMWQPYYTDASFVEWLLRHRRTR